MPWRRSQLQPGNGPRRFTRGRWADAWVMMMMRNLFVREEGDTLIIGSGVRREWIERGEPFGLEHTLTPFGEASVRLVPQENETRLSVEGKWSGAGPNLQVRLPGYVALPGSGPTFLLRKQP